MRRRPGAISALTVLLLLVAPPLARAGGDFVNLAVGSGKVWFVGEPGVRVLDARNGHTLVSPTLANASYPLSVTVAGGAAWVASVENGYVDGKLTRIDTRTRKTRVVWHRPDGAVQYVAAGAGSVWALLGTAGATRIARFSLSGRLERTWSVPGAGRMAADDSGCWISGNEWLLHIVPSGHLERVVRAQFGDIAVGDGAVWLAQATSVLRVDEHTGRVRTLRTGHLQLGGFQHDLAAGNGSLWALTYTGRAHSMLLRLDPATGRRTAHLAVPGIGDALLVQPDAIWLATVIAPPNQVATGYDIVRLDPHTLHRDLVVHIT